MLVEKRHFVLGTVLNLSYEFGHGVNPKFLRMEDGEMELVRATVKQGQERLQFYKIKLSNLR
jgi:hypothetical protein